MLPVPLALQLQDFWGKCSLPLHILDDPPGSPGSVIPSPPPKSQSAVLGGKAVSKYDFAQ